MFAQVSGLWRIDLGDRRSGVQISPVRQQESQVWAGSLGPVELSAPSSYEAGTSPVQRALVRSASSDLSSSDGQ